MATKIIIDVTPDILDKVSRAVRRGKATARQSTITEVDSELEDLVSDRDPDSLPGLFSCHTPITQSFWAEEDGELHVVALVPADFVIPTSEIPDSLKSLLEGLGDSKT